jgi:hypothetical protein
MSIRVRNTSVPLWTYRYSIILLPTGLANSIQNFKANFERLNIVRYFNPHLRKTILPKQPPKNAAGTTRHKHEFAKDAELLWMRKIVSIDALGKMWRSWGVMATG